MRNMGLIFFVDLFSVKSTWNQKPISSSEDFFFFSKIDFSKKKKKKDNTESYKYELVQNN